MSASANPAVVQPAGAQPAGGPLVQPAGAPAQGVHPAPQPQPAG
jgi:hypothetical protein